MENLIQTVAIYALPVVFAITLHEAAHGYVARHFGDPTAWQLGRISLNPLRHVDPVGTVIVPLVILMLSKIGGGGGFLFGWAKPVPVNFGRLRHPKRDMLWVAAAGPGANLVMAFGWAFFLKLTSLGPDNAYSLPMMEMARAGIEVNLVLMALNLIPIPPLDGGRIAVSLLPQRLAWQYARIEPYGIFIVLALFYLHVFDVFLYPLMGMASSLIRMLFNF
jgi:Zn-dependent protease